MPSLNSFNKWFWTNPEPERVGEIPLKIYCSICQYDAIFGQKWYIIGPKYDYSDQTRTPKLIICKECFNTERTPLPFSEII